MELDALLLPLSEQSPAGEDLSFSPDFDAIVEARREDDPTLPLGDWKEKGKEPKSADWPEVQRRCSALLSTRSKDLRLAAWLTEAWAQAEGLPGLARGLQLQARLVGAFWDTLHPLPDGDDQELRTGALAWLLKQVQLLAPRLARPGARPLATRADAEAASAALAALQQAVDARLAADGPSFVKAREALRDAVSSLPPAAADAAMPSPAAPGAAMADVPALPGATASGAPTTRAQALQQLRLVADFFRRTEPHSPVAYLADKAARWGSMDLHLWLRQVVKDESTLLRLEDLLGVEPPRNGA